MIRSATTSATLLGVFLLGIRFPRLVAWPLAIIGTLFGGLGMVRAARSANTEGLSAVVPHREDRASKAPGESR